MTRLALLLILALSLAPAASAGAGEPPIQAQLDRIVARAAARHGFMGAVLVTRDGTTLLDRGYGSASLELDVPNTPATRFRIGSVTKQFTAAAILVLEERGQLRLSDSVARHLPEAPATWATITLHQLLTHTSGIANLTRLPEFRTWVRLPQTAADVLNRLRDLPLDFPPGDRHAYSNSNYLLLGLVIERLSGQPYAAFLHDHVLDPLGLRDTDVDNNFELVPRRAAGHGWLMGTYLNAPYTDMTVPHAAGALYSTTHDLRRWIEGLLAGRLLRPATVARMLTPEREDYALGVRVTTDPDGRRLIAHGGSIAGFSAFLGHYPEGKVTIVVLANVAGGGAIALGRQLGPAVFAPPPSP